MPLFEHPDRKNIEADAKKFATAQTKVIQSEPQTPAQPADAKAETKG